MASGTKLSVLTLNCWGLKFVSKERQDRLTAIGRYLADSNRGYDIVGLQEVWVYEDYVRIRDLVRETLPYSKHWHSGVLGSGLVILSKFPIVSTTMRRFALNGDPFKFYHGDWYVGKCFVSATVAHPTCGEIQVFNSHLHAGYDPAGTPDQYLGCRVGEAWEMSSVVKGATTQGRHVLSLGDYNSAPDSLVIQLMQKQGGLTDAWNNLHPEPRDPIPSNLSPEEGIRLLGVTCDTPLNTWTKHTTDNYLTKDPVGERLDYIFYRQTPELVCNSVEVTLMDQISGIGKQNSGLKNYSDHFGVHATFAIQPATYHFETGHGSNNHQLDSKTDPSQNQGPSTDLLNEVLTVLNHHHARGKARSKLELTIVVPLALIATFGLIIGFFWIQPRWVAFLLALVLSALSSGWIVHFLYGFLFFGENSSSYENTIQEVQTTLDYKSLVAKGRSTVSTTTGMTSISRGGSSNSNEVRQGLLQK